MASWLSLEYLVLGPFSWIYGYGGTLEAIPAHLGAAKSGSTYSLWAPFVAGGLDHLSFWAAADPTNLEPFLFSMLPVWLANGLLGFLQRFLAVYFTARVCEEQLRMSRNVSAAAGVLHAGVSYFTLGESVAIAALPLLIWVLPRIARLQWPTLGAVVAGMGFSTLTTFSQSDPYLLVFTLAWFTIILHERSWRFFACVAIFFLTVGVMDSPQLTAQLYNAPLSHRAGWPAESLGWSLSGLFYYGMHYDFFHQDKVLKAILFNLPPALIILGVPVAWRHRRARPECALFLRLAALYGMLSCKFVFVLAQRATSMVLPWVNGLNVARFYTISASFLIAVTLALCFFVIVPQLPMIRNRRAIYHGAVGALIVFLLVWPKISLFYPLMIDSWGQEHFRVEALDELRRLDRSPFRVASVLDLQPAYAYGQGFETADGWANLFPKVYQELWLRVLDPLFAALPRNREIFEPPGGRPQDNFIFLGSGLLIPGIGLLPGEDPGRALQEGFDIERRFNLHLLSLLNVRYLLSIYPLKAQGLRLIHAPSPPPAVLQSHDYATDLINSPRPRDEGAPPSRQILTDLREAIHRKRRGKDIYIYENTGWLPRYRFVKQVQVMKSGKEVLDALSGVTSETLRETAWTELHEAGKLGPLPALSSGTVRVERYATDEIWLLIDNPGEGFLVIANTWNPFWRAEADGKERALVRTNHAQFGLLTKRGERRIRLSYAPPYSFLRSIILWHR